MDKAWIYLVVIAIIIMVGVGGYELFNSISGGNVKFNKTVTPIKDSFNEQVLIVFYNGQEKILVKTETLSNK